MQKESMGDNIYDLVKAWYVQQGISTEQFFKDNSTEMGLDEMMRDFAYQMLKVFNPFTGCKCKLYESERSKLLEHKLEVVVAELKTIRNTYIYNNVTVCNIDLALKQIGK